LSASASRRKSSTSSDVAAGIVFQNPVLLAWRTALGNIMLQAEARKLDRAAAERRACRLQARPRGYLSQVLRLAVQRTNHRKCGVTPLS
jgi:ABC-type nitrate/sulfonate/bicarbonate transport system ATPase subunit